MKKKKQMSRAFSTLFLAVCSLIYVSPLFIILVNSFKVRTYINLEPFRLPSAVTWAGTENYRSGIDHYGLLSGVGWTLLITLGSMAVILIFCSLL